MASSLWVWSQGLCMLVKLLQVGMQEPFDHLFLWALQLPIIFEWTFALYFADIMLFFMLPYRIVNFVIFNALYRCSLYHWQIDQIYCCGHSVYLCVCKLYVVKEIDFVLTHGKRTEPYIQQCHGYSRFHTARMERWARWSSSLSALDLNAVSATNEFTPSY